MEDRVYRCSKIQDDVPYLDNKRFAVAETQLFTSIICVENEVCAAESLEVNSPRVSKDNKPIDVISSTPLSVCSDKRSDSPPSPTARFTYSNGRSALVLQRRPPGLVSHIISQAMEPDSDDDSDADSFTDHTSPSLTKNSETSVLESWRHLVLRLISKNTNWDNVYTIVHSESTPTVELLGKLPHTKKRAISRLTVARRKSLALQELAERFDRLPEIECDPENWTERYNIAAEGGMRPVTLICSGELQYDMLRGISTDLSETASVDRTRAMSVDDVGSPTPAVTMVLKQLRKLTHILHEFVNTESTFVNDMKKLVTLLNEIKYSTLPRVREFVHAASFVGINTATETINTINTQFLVKLKMFTEQQDEPEESDALMLFQRSSAFCKGIFDSLVQFGPFFPLFSQFIINHDDFSLVYSTLSFEDADFRAYMTSCERMLGESLLSLIIKPVQRLPRYVLLCKEIYYTLTKVCKMQAPYDDVNIRGEYENLVLLEERSRSVYKIISTCAKECNNTVRVHQDNLRMHELNRLFMEGGTDVETSDLVHKMRRIMKEGQLKRHHRHGGVKVHVVQVFSDILLSSSPSGKGLRLEQNISLDRRSDTLCLPIPSMHQSASSSWFVLSSIEKTLYFCAKDSADMLRWVETINLCLKENKADSDTFMMMNQVVLVNTLIGEINRMKTENNHPCDMGDGTCRRARGVSFQPTFVENANLIQTCWWNLVDVLEELDPGGHDSTSEHNLRRVVEHHANEVVSKMVDAIEIGDEKNSDLIASLISGPRSYLISCGIFFEYPGGSNASIEMGERPTMLKLFLMSEVLIVTYLDKVNDPLKYAFHVKLTELECSDYRDGVGDLAILLVNKSARAVKRRFSLIPSQTTPNYSKRLIFATSIDMKFDWLALITQATAHCNHGRGIGDGYASPIESLKSILLDRVETDVLRSAWVTKKKNNTIELL